MYEITEYLATCNMIEGNTPEGWIIVDVRDLKDSGGNSIEEVANKIQLVGNLIASGFKVCIRCQAGMSRSNAIACAALVWINSKWYWDDTWKRIEKKCPRARLNLQFYDTVKRALIKICNGYSGCESNIEKRLI